MYQKRIQKRLNARSFSADEKLERELAMTREAKLDQMGATASLKREMVRALISMRTPTFSLAVCPLWMRSGCATTRCNSTDDDKSRTMIQCLSLCVSVPFTALCFNWLVFSLPFAAVPSCASRGGAVTALCVFTGPVLRPQEEEQREQRRLKEAMQREQGSLEQQIHQLTTELKHKVIMMTMTMVAVVMMVMMMVTMVVVVVVMTSMMMRTMTIMMMTMMATINDDDHEYEYDDDDDADDDVWPAAGHRLRCDGRPSHSRRHPAARAGPGGRAAGAFRPVGGRPADTCQGEGGREREANTCQNLPTAFFTTFPCRRTAFRHRRF